MARARKATEAPTDPLEAMLARLLLSGIRDRLDTPLDGERHAANARANLSARETPILLCEREIARKDHRRIEMGLKLAHFPAVKELAGFDFEAQPSIDPKQIRDLAASRWIANGENVLLPGPPGVGKTHLSIALGREAILAGYTVQFTTATTLAAGLAKAHGERRLDEKLLALSKPKLLIVDELGYLPLEPDAAHLFFQLVSRRYETGAMLITSNRSVAEWGTVFADRWSRPHCSTGSCTTARSSKPATSPGASRTKFKARAGRPISCARPGCATLTSSTRSGAHRSARHQVSQNWALTQI